MERKERLRRHRDGKRGILRGSEGQKKTWGHKGELRRLFEQSTDVLGGLGLTGGILERREDKKTALRNRQSLRRGSDRTRGIQSSVQS